MKKIYYLHEKKEILNENPDEIESFKVFLENEKDFINQIEENLKALEEDIDDEKVTSIINKIKNLHITN